MKRKLVITLICLAVVAAGIVYSLPYLRVYQILVAVQEQDHERLVRYVDFPRLRQALKEQMQAALPTASGRPDDLDRMRRAMTSQIVEQTIEQLITPKGLIAMFYQYRAGLKDPALPQLQAEKGDSSGFFGSISLFAAFLQQARCTYASPSEFRIILGDAGKKTLTVILTRTGLAWRWSRLEITSPAGSIIQP